MSVPVVFVPTSVRTRSSPSASRAAASRATTSASVRSSWRSGSSLIGVTIGSRPVIEATTPARALAVFAHPDDPEVGCGGTLARWAGQGAEVHLVIANRGEKGSNDPATDPDELADRRAVEVERAAAVLGLAGVEHLGYPDGDLENTAELRARLVASIRRVQPEALIA